MIVQIKHAELREMHVHAATGAVATATTPTTMELNLSGSW